MPLKNIGLGKRGNGRLFMCLAGHYFINWFVSSKREGFQTKRIFSRALPGGGRSIRCWTVFADGPLKNGTNKKGVAGSGMSLSRGDWFFFALAGVDVSYPFGLAG